jgi:microsomal dipeptidase-like Zn-dependent dipeptidase
LVFDDLNMNMSWQKWKDATRILLGALITADLLLAAFLWQAARQGPEAMRVQRDRLAAQEILLRADVQRARKIRASLPQVGKDCDAFYHESFLDAASGYSSIQTDINALAAKAGVRTSGLTFTQKDIAGRGVTEISIQTGVSADYPALIRFINNLERSRNFYLLDDLQLGSATAGEIRLQLTLHTYFRT